MVTHPSFLILLLTLCIPITLVDTTYTVNNKKLFFIKNSIHENKEKINNTQEIHKEPFKSKYYYKESNIMTKFIQIFQIFSFLLIISCTIGFIIMLRYSNIKRKINSQLKPLFDSNDLFFKNEKIV
jgi:hypothetical protein